MLNSYIWLMLIAGLLFVSFLVALFIKRRPAILVGGKTKDVWMARPAPTIEMEHIHFMLGTWEVQETWEKGPWGPSSKGKSLFKTRLGPGGLSILTDVESVGPHGRSRSHIVSAWNPFLEAYQGCSVSSLDLGALVWTGKWEQGKLVFDGEIQVRGKKLAFRRVLSEISKTTYNSQEFITEPGEPMKLLVRGTARRKGA
jgi:hypothetical protein